MTDGKTTISFYLSDELVKQLDEAAKTVHMNRSTFVEWLLRQALPLVPVVAATMKSIFRKTEEK
mgnify:CR=1 FL=1